MSLVDPLSLRDPDARCRALETGNILFFPRNPFEIPAQDRQTLLSASQISGSHHKNIAYRPNQDKITGLDEQTPEARDGIHAALRTYSRAAIHFVGELLPRYKDAWRVDYASFRPLEEEGRDLPWKKRNDLLHTDAFPTRPTNGDLILRFFTNINPSKVRVWLTSDPFEKLACERAADAGLTRIATQTKSPLNVMKRAAQKLGVPVVDRSAYDAFMLEFHDYLKGNKEFQESCPKYRFEFPAGSAWMVFTDVVPHAVLSGQHALEQTFIIARSSLSDSNLAPVSILERLAQKQLTI
jgi:hypothetical protein